MLATETPIAFVATAQPERAKAFYRDTLGLRLVEETPVALEFDLAGTMLRVQKLQELMPQPFTALGWRVGDIRATVQALAAKGVAFERYGHFKQDDHGIWVSPAGAKVAWFKDPDGNLLSLTEFGR